MPTSEDPCVRTLCGNAGIRILLPYHMRMSEYLISPFLPSFVPSLGAVLLFRCVNRGDGGGRGCCVRARRLSWSRRGCGRGTHCDLGFSARVQFALSKIIIVFLAGVLIANWLFSWLFTTSFQGQNHSKSSLRAASVEHKSAG